MTAWDRVARAWGHLGANEREVLALVAARLRLAADPRDFGREALEEAADGLVYCAAALMRLRAAGARG
jgi:hypothetical protein